MNRWLRDHHAAITTAKLLEYGCPSIEITKMRRRGELKPIARGVFRSGHVKKTDLTLMSAVCQLIPTASIAFTSAGQLHGIRTMKPMLVQALVPHDASPRIKGVVFHRCRNIDDETDYTTRDDDIRVTTVPRTLFDAADMLGFDKTVSAIEDALNKELCTFEELVSIGRRLAHRHRPGSRTFMAVLRSREPWRAAMQSGDEITVLEAIKRLGLPTPVTQYPLTLPDGKEIFVDFAWPDQRVILEVDHSHWHDGAGPSRKDKHRDRQLTVMAWLPMRITDTDVEQNLDESLGDVAAVLQQRMAPVS